MLTLPLLFLQELFYEDRYYHAQCFRCFRCDRSLADQPFTSQGDALMCRDCYCTEFSSKCTACDKILMPGSDGRECLMFHLPDGEFPEFLVFTQTEKFTP